MSNYLEYWYIALNHRRGVKLRSSAPDRFIQLLYKARKAANDPSLDKLSIVRPSGDQLWIIHREAQEPQTDPQTHPQPL